MQFANTRSILNDPGPRRIRLESCHQLRVQLRCACLQRHPVSHLEPFGRLNRNSETTPLHRSCNRYRLSPLLLAALRSLKHEKIRNLGPIVLPLCVFRSLRYGIRPCPIPGMDGPDQRPCLAATRTPNHHSRFRDTDHIRLVPIRPNQEFSRRKQHYPTPSLFRRSHCFADSLFIRD